MTALLEALWILFRILAGWTLLAVVFAGFWCLFLRSGEQDVQAELDREQQSHLDVEA